MRKDYDLEDAFAAIEDELIDSMMRNMKRHKVEEIDEDKQWEMWQSLQLQSLEQYKKDNQEKFRSWFSDINEQIDEVIRQANQSGQMEQEIEILQAIKDGFKGARRSSSTMQAEFFRLNERKLDALIKATTNDMKKAEMAILRMADDQYRKAIFNAQVYANTGAGTYEKAVDMATKGMLSSGLNCVEYVNGARHTLKDYADMAIRTASKRAYLQGEGVKRQEWGISTVIINKRGNPCPKCLPFCGKVLIDDVWSGGKASDGPYPLMSKAIAAGLYHPRCKDSHTTYFEGVSSPPENKYTKAEIQQIEDDYREEQKRQYAKRQAEKYERMEKHSLDGENKRKYRKRKTEWNEQVTQLDDTERILNTTYKAKDLDDLSLEELRKIAEKKGTEYYKSGKFGISFGDATPEEAAKKLAQAGSKTSLKKDILSIQKKMGKTVVKTGDSDIIEMYRKGSTHRKISSEGKKVIDKATYHKITKPAIEIGADIRIADDEADGVILARLIEQNATAVTYGDVIYFRKDATVSDVLEEVHHFYQNKRGMNSQYRPRQRIILNEIDAKEYLLSVTEKYKIPLEEVELTKKQLESYKEEMEELIKRGEWDE